MNGGVFELFVVSSEQLLFHSLFTSDTALGDHDVAKAGALSTESTAVNTVNTLVNSLARSSITHSIRGSTVMTKSGSQLAGSVTR